MGGRAFDSGVASELECRASDVAAANVACHPCLVARSGKSNGPLAASHGQLAGVSLLVAVACLAAPARFRCRLCPHLCARPLPLHEPGLQPAGCHPAPSEVSLRGRRRRRRQRRFPLHLVPPARCARRSHSGERHGGARPLGARRSEVAVPRRARARTGVNGRRPAQPSSDARRNQAFFSNSVTTPVSRSTVSVSLSFSPVERVSRTPSRYFSKRSASSLTCSRSRAASGG